MTDELRPAVKTYLDAISAVSRVGTPELSHYTALDNLLDAVGGQLSPSVRAVVHYSETASGQPDLGFFSADNTDPDRGVVEVKAADADLDQLIASEQVDSYWQTHKLVLVTNLREFALVGQDNSGAKATLERYSLADSAAAFDDLLQHRVRAANRHGVALGEYLLRVMSHRSTISEPRDLARLLASYARDALQRVEQAAEEEDSLKPIREAIEQALGMSFESEDGGQVLPLDAGADAVLRRLRRMGAVGAGGPNNDAGTLRLEGHGLRAARAGAADALPPDHGPRTAGSVGAGRGARLDRGGAGAGRPRGVPHPLFGGRGGAVLLRTLPRSLRPPTAQTARRLVHAARGRPLHGRACRPRPARRPGHRQGTRR